MATGKRYYWIKMKETLMTSSAFYYLLGQPGGTKYIVFYEMLLMKAINTDGVLGETVGEIFVPYDTKRIHDEMGWLSEDEIKNGLTLLKKLGMISRREDGVLYFENFGDYVGSETDYALPKAKLRKVQTADTTVDNTVDRGVDNVHTDIDIDIEVEVEVEKEKEKYSSEEREVPSASGGEDPPEDTFPPTEKMIKDFCLKNGLKIDPLRFYNYYQNKGWYDGKGRYMVDWRLKCLDWNKSEYSKGPPRYKPKPLETKTFDTDDFFEAACRRSFR